MISSDKYIYHVKLDGNVKHDQVCITIFQNKNKPKQTKHTIQKQTWIVKQLVKKLPEAEGYMFYLDRGYSSLGLANWLHEKGHKFLLSVRNDRPSWLFTKGLKVPAKGELRYAVKEGGEMAAATWHDRKPFNMLTNMIDPQMTDVKEVPAKPWKGIKAKSVRLPQFVVEYRRHYHLVDLINQQCVRVLFNRRARKWTTHILHMVIVWSAFNAWRLYSLSHEQLPFSDFLDGLTEELTFESCAARKYYNRYHSHKHKQTQVQHQSLK